MKQTKTNPSGLKTHQDLNDQDKLKGTIIKDNPVTLREKVEAILFEYDHWFPSKEADAILALFENSSKEREKELLKDLTDAWLVEGINPEYHKEKKMQLFEEWKTLFRSVDNLVERQKLKALERTK